MPKKDSTLRQAIFDAAFQCWCEIAPLDELLALREKRRADDEAAVVEEAGRELPANEPASTVGS